MRPNILWICTDQQRVDTLSCMGNKYIRTPNLDSLAQEGMAFENTFSQSAICTPSRACFMTGRYPKTTRVNGNGNEYFPPDEKLISKIFAENGYDCGLVGKQHLSMCQKMEEERNDDGYTFYEWSHHPNDDWESGHAYQDWLKAKGIKWDDYYIVGSGNAQEGKDNPWAKPLPPGKGGMPSEYHQTTWAFERAKYFINQDHQGKPWYININIFDPHPPYDPPKTSRDKIDASKLPLPLWKDGELDNKPEYYKLDYEDGSQGGTGPCAKNLSDDMKRQLKADYYAMVEHLDERLGEFLKDLEESGQLENTIVLFHSDHGEMNGDHGLYWKGAYSYDQLIHVPLIMSWKNHIKKDVKAKAFVELVDLAPTLLDLAGIEIPYYMQGKSFAPILLGNENPDHFKDAIHSEYYYAIKGIHHYYVSIYRDAKFKIAVHHTEDISELYDLENDPNEFNNLWGKEEYKDIQSEYLKKCFDKMLMDNIDPKPRMLRYF